ncbi:transcriptional regulator MtlR [Carnobacterium sp. 17-4]|uniref:BglG family transcription antiterminator n=1 Tax=Carnobacterium sp. (strain 17-4) TaxID=208596 RepID=UPI0002058C3E|nr:HTH domain-containing protein [Carnobacterium sp. 17-4]AEB30730.1 transcriptional regulator MtlR [Carnobacterium sp. 17-4]
MYFSIKEKQLLELLLLNKTGISLEVLARELEVSSRTIYRELALAEDTLSLYQIALNKKIGTGFYLSGEIEELNRLKKDLLSTDLIFDSKDRQSYLICQLLLAKDNVKLIGLAQDFNVSPGTINNDLTKITEIIEGFQMTLQRGKGKAVSIKSDEESLRLIVSGIITSKLNEYEFLNIFQNEYDEEHFERVQKTRMPFLSFLTYRYFKIAVQTTFRMKQHFFEDISNSGLMQFIVILTLMIMRLSEDNQLEKIHFEEKEDTTLTNNITEYVIKDIFQETELQLLKSERIFLKKAVNGVRFFQKQDLFSADYNMELTYQIKNFIHLVETEAHWEFSKDHTLFSGLLTHLEALLNRAFTPVLQVEDSLYATIRERYPEIYKGIIVGLAGVFPDKRFSENDYIYLVIHFASSWENYKKIYGLKAMVICTSGIGTSRILENRLNKHFSELKEITVVSLSEVNDYKLTDFDFIFSTIFLPHFTVRYHLITPMLLSEELVKIKGLIDECIDQKKDYTLSDSIKEINKQNSEKIPTEKTLKEIHHLSKTALGILNYFSIESINGNQPIEESLLWICRQLQDIGVLTDAENVQQKLIERANVAPVGIPGTQMGLFHVRNTHVVSSYFGIYELEQEVPIIGIDRKDMGLKRILIMVAPYPLNVVERDLLGLVSSMVIENDSTTALFDKGEEEAVRKKIEKEFKAYVLRKTH